MADMVGQVQNVPSPNNPGVTIQILNPSVNVPEATPPPNVNTTNYNTNITDAASPSYPPNYYTQNLVQPQAEPEKPKTEKREIVELTDDYIRNLGNYLSDTKNEKVRIMAANEVLMRLQEDPSRRDNPALNALLNQMLQDRCEAVKFAAIAALKSRVATGNDKTVEIVKSIQQNKKSKNGLGKENAMEASDTLLKMSGNVIEKEFEVKDQPQKEG